MLQIKRIRTSRIHFASLDGAHDYENVRFEARSIAEMQQPGDIIYFDDYNPSEFQGVVEAVDEFVAECGYEMEQISYGEGKCGVIARRSGGH